MLCLYFISFCISTQNTVFISTSPFNCAGHCLLLLFNCLVVSNSFVTPWAVAHQAPLSMGFPRQEYRSGCNFLLQGIVLDQGLNPRLLHCSQILYRRASREARVINAQLNCAFLPGTAGFHRPFSPLWHSSPLPFLC